MIPLVSFAGNSPVNLDYIIQAQPIQAGFQTLPDGQKVSVAQLNSAVAMTFNYPLLDLSVDYQLQGDLRSDENADEEVLTQAIKSVLRSHGFNDFFNVDAVIKADSLVKEQGEVYRHLLTSEFTRPLSRHAGLNLQFSYGLDKPSEVELKREISGYSLGVGGKLAKGRLRWQTDYGQSHRVKADSTQQNMTKTVNFNSHYVITPAMQLDLSGILKRSLLVEDGEDKAFDEQRYTAGFSWLPARDYAISLQLNRKADTQYGREDVFGSGSITWSPNSPWQIELSYDDYLFEGLKGVMLRATIELDES